MLVSKGEPSTTHDSRSIVSGSLGPGTSERVWMAIQMLRVNTPEVVLGSRQRLFLPEGHPLLSTVDWSFQTFRVQGRITAALDGPSLYQLELSIPIDTSEGDVLVSLLMSNHADLLILEGVSGPVILPDN